MNRNVIQGTFQGLHLPAATRKPLRWLNIFNNPLEKLICLHQINHIYAQAAAAPGQWQFLASLLGALNVTYELAEGDLARIPSQGPVVVVANHPFGGLEGIILPLLFGKVRQDVKIMANYLLQPVSELRDLFIYVDPFGTANSPKANLSGLREGINWLKQGGVLGVFPAGEVSHYTWSNRRVTDPVWSRTLARLTKRTGAAVVPVFFAGQNSFLFQLLGMVHPMLRTALLPREILKKRNTAIQVKIGRVITQERLQTLTSDNEVMDYLRLRTYMLQENFESHAGGLGNLWRQPLKKEPVFEDVIEAPPLGAMIKEVNLLPADQTLVQSGGQTVYYAYAHQIPNLLQEIGRLREITFREVKEGTGRSIDLDRFDDHYLHLFLWNQEKQELVGAYRLGCTDTIMADQGPRGLYTATLFDFEAQFLAATSPALELGRSFIRWEYQKNYSALLMLWKGIGHFVVRQPQYRILFGPVSISNEYSEFSQGLLATWLKMNSFLPELAQFIRPKNPLRIDKDKNQDIRLALTGTHNVEEISALLADADPQKKGVPILLKQYLKLGGKLVGFNRDPLFHDVLDGLILVDLLQTSSQVLQRYMGQSGLASFLRWHGQLQAPTGVISARSRRTFGLEEVAS